MAASNTETEVRPKIVVSDLSAYGIDDFQEGYGQLSRMERQLFWRSLLELGCQVVSGQGIRGATYHRLLSMMNNAFPGMDIDDSIFERITPQFAPAGGLDSVASIHDGQAAPAPAASAGRGSSRPSASSQSTEAHKDATQSSEPVSSQSDPPSETADAAAAPDNATSEPRPRPGPGPAPVPERSGKAKDTPFANLLD